MYAVASLLGKQYKVSVDDIISVDKLNAEPGDKIKFDVLMVSNDGKVVTGSPIEGASVEAEVLRSGKGKKILVYKYKAKKNQRKKKGHRQPYTILKVLSINS